MKKKPYSQRTDIEKIESNWKKSLSLLHNGEYSSAIVRSVTAAEIAANFVIREELQEKRNIESDFVDVLLRWANGIEGKFNRIILPLSKRNASEHSHFKKIKKKVEDINEERNFIVHGGQFKDRMSAKKLIMEVKDIIELLIREYKNNFRLKKA